MSVLKARSVTMRCVNLEELRVVSGGGDPKGCYDAIMVGSGAGAAAGSYVGAVGGSVVPVLGTGAGIAIVGAVGTLAGGAMAAANSPACSTDSAADSFLLNADQSSAESDRLYDSVIRVLGYYTDDWMWDTAWEW